MTQQSCVWQAKRLELSRQVQELRFQLQQEQAAAAIAAEQHKRDIAKQLQKQAADTVARQAVCIMSRCHVHVEPLHFAANSDASGFNISCVARPTHIISFCGPGCNGSQKRCLSQTLRSTINVASSR